MTDYLIFNLFYKLLGNSNFQFKYNYPKKTFNMYYVYFLEKNKKNIAKLNRI